MKISATPIFILWMLITRVTWWIRARQRNSNVYCSQIQGKANGQMIDEETLTILSGTSFRTREWVSQSHSHIVGHDCKRRQQAHGTVRKLPNLKKKSQTKKHNQQAKMQSRRSKRNEWSVADKVELATI